MVDLGRWFNEEYAVPAEDVIDVEGLRPAFGPAPGEEEPEHERDA